MTGRLLTGESLAAAQPLSARALTAGLLLMCLATVALVWCRTGVLPASSTGDEVWGSESAWWLLHDGVLRRDMHADEIGSAVRDYLPPVPALGQAVAFALLGVSQFSMGVCASLGFTAIALFAYLLARQFGLARWESLIASFSLSFAPPSAAQLLGVRYDVYVVTLLVASLYLLDVLSEARRPSRTQQLRWVASGMCLGGAGVAYFGSSVGLGLCLLAVVVAQSVRIRSPRPVLCFCAGAALVIGAYVPFVLADLPLFLKQMVESAAAYRGASFALSPRLLLPVGACTLLAGAMVFVLRKRRSVTQRQRSRIELFLPLAAAAVLFWAMSSYFYPRYQLVATTLTSLCVSLLLALPTLLGSKLHALVRVLSLALFAASMTLLLGAGVTAIAQARDRDYSVVIADVSAAANLDGLVLTESPGWLALRPLTGRGQLHHLLPKVGDPSDLNASMLLASPQTGARVSTILVRADRIQLYRRLYPAVEAFMGGSDVVGPIEIDGQSRTYHMQAWVRRRQ